MPPTLVVILKPTSCKQRMPIHAGTVGDPELFFVAQLDAATFHTVCYPTMCGLLFVRSRRRRV
eukprot:1705627-Amphidinium_carterae.1